jgi:hypothetical protein
MPHWAFEVHGKGLNPATTWHCWPAGQLVHCHEHVPPLHVVKAGQSASDWHAFPHDPVPPPGNVTHTWGDVQGVAHMPGLPLLLPLMPLLLPLLPSMLPLLLPLLFPPLLPLLLPLLFPPLLPLLLPLPPPLLPLLLLVVASPASPGTEPPQ